LALAQGLCWTAEPEAIPAPAAQGMTLAELETLALRSNPTLTQAAAQIDAARGKALQAGLYPNPTVGYVGDQMGTAGTAGELQGGFIEQTIITGKKLRLSRAKYDQEANEAAILADAQELRVLTAVRLHFYRLLARQRILDLHRELLKNAEESLRTHKEMANTGQASQPDVLLAEVEMNRSTLALRTAQNQYRAAWEALRAVVGAPDLCAASLDGKLEPDGAALDWQTSLDRLLSDSPELQAAHAHVLHDQIALKREKVEPIPDVTIQAATGFNYETRSTVAGVQVGIPLPVFDRNQGTIRQAQADLMRSTAEVSRVELSLRQRLADVFSDYQTAWESAQLLRESSLPKARLARDIMRDMYQKRRAPWMQVVQQERNLFDVQADYTRALLELREAETAIQGLLLTDGLAEPAAPTPGGHIEATPKPR
jgi:cobalt-zinc-cadmium efflux system outer membrane protein